MVAWEVYHFVPILTVVDIIIALAYFDKIGRSENVRFKNLIISYLWLEVILFQE